VTRDLIQDCKFGEAVLSRGDLSEAEWRVLDEILPAVKGRRGRPPLDRRATVNGILWRLRTGAPWRDVPERYGNWNSIWRCFRRWSLSGLWEAAATALAETMADNERHSIDSTIVRGHPQAAGAKGGLANRRLAAREAGSPVRFIVLPTPAAGPSPSTSPAARQRTARPTKS
jgi:transposase